MKRYAPLSLAIAAALAITLPASAQQTNDSPLTDEKQVERIEVTGSRIRGVDLEGSQPLVVISADDIKNSGASTIYE